MSEFSKVFISLGCEVFSLFLRYFFEILMAFGFAPFLVDVATPVVVDIKDHPHPEFKRCPQIAKVNDSIGAFSRVIDGVLCGRCESIYSLYSEGSRIIED